MSYNPIIGGNDSRIKETSSATLIGGTVVVNTAFATATCKIFICGRTGILNLGSVSVSAISVGVSFTILSTNVLDTRTIDYIIFEP